MLLILCAALGAGIIAFAEVTPGPKPPADTEMSKMRDELERLKAKVEMLEFRTKGLESEVQQLKRSPAPAPLSLQGTPAAPSSLPLNIPSRPPTIWGQGEVNGWTYYIVPCEQQSR